ncbi:MAG: carboxypeptidase-like regulatory domain-containing protein, partial [Prevotellaceae bacterium]|nr:carboxypeptidase-like regulatory domain-containing protein [Prevotellaceae bacterium]
MNKLKIICTPALLCAIFSSTHASGAPKRIEGFVHHFQTLAPIAGATIWIRGTGRGAMTGANGRFMIENLEKDTGVVEIKCMSYKTVATDYRLKGEVTRLDIGMESEALKLDEVVVKGTVRRSAEIGMVQSIKSLPQVASGMSGAQIAKGP